jgi:hypothetical protein
MSSTHSYDREGFLAEFFPDAAPRRRRGPTETGRWRPAPA